MVWLSRGFTTAHGSVKRRAYDGRPDVRNVVETRRGPGNGRKEKAPHKGPSDWMVAQYSGTGHDQAKADKMDRNVKVRRDWTTSKWSLTAYRIHPTAAHRESPTAKPPWPAEEHHNSALVRRALRCAPASVQEPQAARRASIIDVVTAAAWSCLIS